MKLIGIVGNDIEKRYALQVGLAKNLGFWSFSARDEATGFLLKNKNRVVTRSASELRSVVEMLASNSGLVETLLLARVFNDASHNAAGLVVTDILEQKTVDLIRKLGGSIVFVGNNDYRKPISRAHTVDNANINVNLDNFTAQELKKFINSKNILPGFAGETVQEALVIQQNTIQELTVAGFKVLDTQI